MFFDRAYPDFLLRAASEATCAALLRESRMQIIKATGLDRKFGGAQGSAVFAE
jgi:hypothetical protein